MHKLQAGDQVLYWSGDDERVATIERLIYSGDRHIGFALIDDESGGEQMRANVRAYDPDGDAAKSRAESDRLTVMQDCATAGRNIAFALGLAAAHALGIAAGADAAFDYGNGNSKALLKRVGYWE